MHSSVNYSRTDLKSQLLKLEWHCSMMLTNPSSLLGRPVHRTVHWTMSLPFCLYSYLQLCQWCLYFRSLCFMHVHDKVPLFDSFLCIYFLTVLPDNNSNYEKLIILCRSVLVIPIIILVIFYCWRKNSKSHKSLLSPNETKKMLLYCIIICVSSYFHCVWFFCP